MPVGQTRDPEQRRAGGQLGGREADEVPRRGEAGIRLRAPRPSCGQRRAPARSHRHAAAGQGPPTEFDLRRDEPGGDRPPGHQALRHRAQYRVQLGQQHPTVSELEQRVHHPTGAGRQREQPLTFAHRMLADPTATSRIACGVPRRRRRSRQVARSTSRQCRPRTPPPPCASVPGSSTLRSRLPSGSRSVSSAASRSRNPRWLGAIVACGPPSRRRRRWTFESCHGRPCRWQPYRRPSGCSSSHSSQHRQPKYCADRQLRQPFWGRRAATRRRSKLALVCSV